MDCQKETAGPGRLHRIVVAPSTPAAIDIVQSNSLLSIAREEDYMQAYCMKCRAKKEIKNPKSIVMKNKRPATQGVCPTCGTKVFRIGK